jgi:hypothetical protein
VATPQRKFFGSFFAAEADGENARIAAKTSANARRAIAQI